MVQENGERKGDFVGPDTGVTYDNPIYFPGYLGESLIKEEIDSGTLNIQSKLTPLIKSSTRVYTQGCLDRGGEEHLTALYSRGS